MGSGTGRARIARLYLSNGLVVNCKAFDEKYKPNAEGHSDITTDRVLWHSTGLKEWTVDVEVEIQPGQKPIHPADIDENNPADLLIVGTIENRRYIQGLTTDAGISFKDKDTEKLKFTIGHFKDCVPE